MDHSYYRDKISAYFDGALEAQERELIRRHLEDCVECQSLLERLSRLDQVVKEKSSLGGDEYFEKLAQKIESRIAAPREKVVDVKHFRWKTIWWKVSAAAASVLLVGTIGYYQFRDGSQLPSKVLKEPGTALTPGSINEDSLAARENFESGRDERTDEAGQRALVGQAADGDALAKKKESGKLEGQEKDARQEVKSDELRSLKENNAPAEGALQAGAAKPSAAKTEDMSASLKQKAMPSSIVAEEKAILDSIKPDLADLEFASNTLVQWRSQRDSIQSVLGFEQDTVQNIAKNQISRLAAPTVSGYAQKTDSTMIYQQLAYSWYQIGLQTQDSTEKNRAVQFLNWYKGRFPVDSPMVNQQLQQLPK
ncbi:MAG TPA: zf-HC2 domain-containing protein [candidate division Zixibacteria bacterium]|nr:zf-HC2 domain-containing protein [candidate division Zixibacteria bacterium]